MGETDPCLGLSYQRCTDEFQWLQKRAKESPVLQRRLYLENCGRMREL